MEMNITAVSVRPMNSKNRAGSIRTGALMAAPAGGSWSGDEEQHTSILERWIPVDPARRSGQSRRGPAQAADGPDRRGDRGEGVARVLVPAAAEVGDPLGAEIEQRRHPA